MTHLVVDGEWIGVETFVHRHGKARSAPGPTEGMPVDNPFRPTRNDSQAAVAGHEKPAGESDGCTKYGTRRETVGLPRRAGLPACPVIHAAFMTRSVGVHATAGAAASNRTSNVAPPPGVGL